MRKKVTFSVILMSIAVVLAAQETTPEPEKFKITWEWVVIAVTSLYEFTARVIPTPKDYTVLGKVFKILKTASDFLNRKK